MDKRCVLYELLGKLMTDVDELAQSKTPTGHLLTGYDIGEETKIYCYLKGLVDKAKGQSIFSIFKDEIDKIVTCDSTIEYRLSSYYYFEFEATSFELAIVLTTLLKIYLLKYDMTEELSKFETDKKEIIDTAYVTETRCIDDHDLTEKIETIFQPFISMAEQFIVV